MGADRDVVELEKVAKALTGAPHNARDVPIRERSMGMVSSVNGSSCTVARIFMPKKCHRLPTSKNELTESQKSRNFKEAASFQLGTLLHSDRKIRHVFVHVTLW